MIQAVAIFTIGQKYRAKKVLNLPYFEYQSSRPFVKLKIVDVGEERAMVFRKLLIKQKCFPIKYEETDTKIVITYHFNNPIVEEKP